MRQLEKPEAEKECDCMKKWNQTINLIMILSVVATIVRFLVDYVDLLILRWLGVVLVDVPLRVYFRSRFLLEAFPFGLSVSLSITSCCHLFLPQLICLLGAEVGGYLAFIFYITTGHPS